LKLGLEKVPVHVASGLSPAQIQAYRIADNQTATLSSWDDDRLPLELAELQGLNFDLSLTGFGEEELLRLLDSGPNQADPDAVPEPPDKPETQPGDLWLLGRHRLLCGDSSQQQDVDRLLDGAQVHLVNTDPPYNVRVEPRSNNAIAAGLSSFEGTKHHQRLDLTRHPDKAKPTGRKLRAKDRPLANDFVSDTEFLRLLRLWFGNIARVLLPGRSFLIWGGYSRFLLHVLPKRFVRIRHYGLLAGRNVASQWTRCRQLLGVPDVEPAVERTWLDWLRQWTGQDLSCCPHCQGPLTRLPLETMTTAQVQGPRRVNTLCEVDSS
jgi:hypothetical protein